MSKSETEEAELEQLKSVECPTCKAAVGQFCHSGSSRITYYNVFNSHRLRRQAANLLTTTPAQMMTALHVKVGRRTTRRRN